jgi:hypothetical protein
LFRRSLDKVTGWRRATVVAEYADSGTSAEEADALGSSHLPMDSNQVRAGRAGGIGCEPTFSNGEDSLSGAERGRGGNHRSRIGHIVCLVEL